MMPEVFISYRREDSSGHAGRIFDCMRERFGDESVFMDVTDIQPGVDFTQALDSALSSCRVVLVVIGSQWLTSTDSASGLRRLDDPGDHVRLEIARALARKAHVIPVLVRGALMPREKDLPVDLRPLARRQAHELSDSRWSFDIDQLVHIVERDLGVSGGGERAAPASPVQGAFAPLLHPSWIRVIVPAAVIVGLLGLAAAFRWAAVEEPPGASAVRPPSSPDDGAIGRDASDPARSAARELEAQARSAMRELEARARSVTGEPKARENIPARLPASAEVRAGAARYKVLGGRVSREPGGTQTVRLFVRTTNVDKPYGFAVTPDSFRLIVDGQAVAPTQAPAVAMSMQSAIEDWIEFLAPPKAGAVALQVGDFRQETARIPIDLRLASRSGSDKPALSWRSPVELAATIEKRVGPLMFKLDGARLEHFGDALPPQPERLIVSFKIRIENVGQQYGAVVSGDLFRLLVDGVPLAPTKTPVEGLTLHAHVEGEVAFLMPGTASSAILQIGSVAAETEKIPIDLSRLIEASVADV